MGYQFNMAGGSVSGASSYSANGATGSASPLTTLATGQSLGSNFTTSPTLPSWLPTSANSLDTELQNQYTAAPASIMSAADASAGALNKSANISYDQNMRQAADATAQLTASNRQQGGTAATSSIVGGQMAEQAQSTRQDARVQIAQMKQQATDQAASLSSQIAGNLASLRTSYLGTLAGVSTTERSQDMNYAEFADSQITAANTKAAAAASTLPSGTFYTGQPGAGSGTYLGPLGTPVTPQNIAAAGGG